MNALDRETIAESARRHAVESARAQDLPETITDPDVLRRTATLINPAVADGDRKEPSA